MELFFNLISIMKNMFVVSFIRPNYKKMSCGQLAGSVGRAFALEAGSLSSGMHIKGRRRDLLHVQNLSG